MSTKITTGIVRFSFVHVFEPAAMQEGQTPKYSVTLLIPKTDTATINKIKAAIEEAKTVYLTKHPGAKMPAKPKTTIHDGDGERPSGGEFGPECKGCYVMTVSSNNKPVIVDVNKAPITDPLELYSGCYGKAVLNFYYYDTAGNKGVSAGLNGVMKTSDGEPLSGAVVTDSDWDDEDDFGADDDLLG